MNFRLSVAALIIGLTLLPARLLAGPTLLFDPANGKILYSEDLDLPWHPASITKIMTAYVTFAEIETGRLTLQSKIPYSTLAEKMPASKIGLKAGSEVTVDFALRALIIKSANDIAVALAEAVGGSHDAFVQRMNDTAQRLGMTRTKFVNPNGLPAPEQVTTARDLARLTRAVQRDYPQHAHYWAMSHMRVGKRRLRSHNSLLRTFHGADGVKTGYICDSGYNVVASATRDGHRLVAIVLGERSPRERALRAASLLEHGFNTYGWKLIFDTANLDTLPPSTTLTTATSLRRTICNRRLVRSKARKRRRKRTVKRRSRVATAKSRKSSTKSSSATRKTQSRSKN